MQDCTAAVWWCILLKVVASEEIARRTHEISCAAATKVGVISDKVSIYCVTHHYLKKFSYGFWDNQWFGRNQIYLKLKLGAMQFMPGIKNLNLKFFDIFLNFKRKKFQKKILKI
jgi:hypothetical protein